MYSTLYVQDIYVCICTLYSAVNMSYSELFFFTAVENIQTMFPDMPESELYNAVQVAEDIDDAANILLERKGVQSDIGCQVKRKEQ